MPSVEAWLRPNTPVHGTTLAKPVSDRTLRAQQYQGRHKKIDLSAALRNRHNLLIEQISFSKEYRRNVV